MQSQLLQRSVKPGSLGKLTAPAAVRYGLMQIPVSWQYRTQGACNPDQTKPRASLKGMTHPGLDLSEAGALLCVYKAWTTSSTACPYSDGHQH